MRLILTGILFIIGGASGSMVLRGTGSSGALAMVGVVLLIVGVIQAANGSGGESSARSDSFDDPERDREQMEEYERTKARIAEARAQHPITEEAQELIDETPGAEEQIKQLLKSTKGHLDVPQRQALVLETAKRLHADHRRTEQAAGR